MPKVTLYLDGPDWQAFRMACLERKITASEVVRTLIHTQLETWQTEEPKQPSEDHS